MKKGEARKIHFIGIGGIGMSALAQILLKKGFKVSGSDTKEGSTIDLIKSLGGEFFLGHSELNIKDDVSEVVYSSSIDASNRELKEARRRPLKVMHRSEMLLELSKDKLTVFVTGSHGKTTTTSLISLMLKNAGLEPTCCIGGQTINFKSNAVVGEGKFFVAELDESDGTFLKFNPHYAVLTNIDREHLDYFKNLKEIIKLNKKFINQIKDGGRLFACGDDSNIKNILKGYKRDVGTYGLLKSNLCYAKDIALRKLKSEYTCVYDGKILGSVRLNIPGIHNVVNSLASVTLGKELGLDFDKIKTALFEYKGTLRRFEIKMNKNGIMIVEDYAHHPTEIEATVKAGRLQNFSRLIGVFQPHRFTRTKFLAKEFGKSLAAFDKLILTDIYSASEKPLKGVGIENIQKEVIKNRLKDITILKKDSIAGYLFNIARRGDLIMVLGAGDINKVAAELAEKLG